MFIFNNKYINNIVLLFLLTLNKSHRSGVSIVEFEQVNVAWKCYGKHEI